MPTVNPEILIWARETAGFTLSQAAAAIGIKDGKKHRAVEKLALLESGQLAPSRPQLLKMAQKYRRPLLTFYLDAPPRRGDRGEDFRSVPDRQAAPEARVDALVRDIRARQATVRDFILEDETRHKLSFIGSADMADGIDVVLNSIRSNLRLGMEAYRDQVSPEKAFAYLRTKAESAGIFVLLIGNLGSHHTNISVDAFRGFALADDIAPFVVINDQDAPTAWSFTLLHEITHLWLGKTGLSGRSHDLQIEKFCNDVAARFLLPSDEVVQTGVTLVDSEEVAISKIDKFATDRHLSRSMVAYSLLRAGLMTDATWKTITAWFFAQWRKGRDAKKDRQKDRKGPDYYVVRRHRLGLALLELVSRGIDEGSLTPTRASKVLGVKPRSVAPLLSIRTSSGRAA
jgi:Zn-dependent peptidase ImmA (M78 family)